MSRVAMQFKNFNQAYINKILYEKLNYIVDPYQEGREIFCFEGNHFLQRFGYFLPIDAAVSRFAYEISNYSYVNGVRYSYDPDRDMHRIVVLGRESLDPFAESMNRFNRFVEENSSYIKPIDPEPLRRYLEEDEKAVLDAYKRDTEHLRIPKTFDVYSGYSRDGRLRTVVHWQDGVKTSVYLEQDDFDNIYLAIAYCYVKRKFGSMSHFKRIVERNTKEVTTNVKRFIYGGDSTLLVNMYSIYDQVALYLAISYLGDTDQWLTEEDMKRLEDSVHE